MILIGTISGIGLCYHLMRTAWVRTRLDTPLVVGYTALLLTIAHLLT